MLYVILSLLAFADINPLAPVHLLIIPKKHIASLNELTDDDDESMSRLLRAAQTLAASHGIADSGYRTYINTGPDANQIVFHIHMHLLGGESLGPIG